MSFDPISSLLNIGETLITRLFPDPAQQAQERLKMAELAQKGDLAQLEGHIKLMTKQAEINLADAKSGRFFQASWRPAIGWVGAISLALMYIPKALVMTYIWTFQAITILNGWDGLTPLTVPKFPDLGVSDIIGLLMSMLGVAAMRSYDKKQGTDTK